MPLSIASNIYSLKVQTAIGRTSSELGDTFERLSSGSRLNKASDGAADLAVADRLKTDARLGAVAVRNSNDGLSFVGVIDAAQNAVSQLLTRMSELANQASNSIYTVSQRSALDSEFTALGSEIQRVAVTTAFNGIAGLSGTSNVVLQVGIDGSANSRFTIPGVLATLSSFSLGTAGGALSYSLNGNSVDAGVTASRLALTAITSAQDTLNTSRGLVGAAGSALSFVISNLTNQREQKLAAESRIRDADIASDVANLVRLQVLQQAQTAILAQANQQPAAALKLLG